METHGSSASRDKVEVRANSRDPCGGPVTCAQPCTVRSANASRVAGDAPSTYLVAYVASAPLLNVQRKWNLCRVK